MGADPGRGHYPVNKKTARILADEPRQHGPRSGDPVPGTPHWKAGALPREGAVPLNTRHTSNHEGGHHFTSHAGCEGTAPPRRLDSPLYKREPRPIHIDMPFMHFNASGMEVPGLDPEYPGSSIKNGESMVFVGELGTLVYVFQAEGYAPITREINLNHGHGYHLQTLAGIACDLIRGFYQNVRSFIYAVYSVLVLIGLRFCLACGVGSRFCQGCANGLDLSEEARRWLRRGCRSRSVGLSYRNLTCAVPSPSIIMIM